MAAGHNRNPIVFPAFIALLLGYSAIAYQTVWLKYLQLIFGVSAYAAAAVLTGYMLGMAAGGLAFGAAVDRVRDKKRLFLIMTAALGLCTALSPVLYGALNSADIGVFRGLNLSGEFGKNMIRLGLSAAFMLIPTALTGGTLPVIIRIYGGGVKSLEKDSGYIYAANTAGLILGAFVVSFFLIGSFGMFASALTGTAACAAAALALGLGPAAPEHGVIKREKPGPAGNAKRGPASYIILLIYGLSGLTCLAYEVFFNKVLPLFFRDTAYDFAIILIIFLLGFSIGSAACSKILSSGRLNPRKLFAACEILIGLYAMASLALIERLPYLTDGLQSMNNMYAAYGGGYFIMAALIKTGLCAAAALPITVFFGATYPAVCAIYAGSDDTIGARLGLLSCLNSLGAAAGALLAGFILIGFLSLRSFMLAAGFLNILIGCFAFAYFFRAKRKTLVYPAAVIVVSVMASLAVPPWDRLRMSTSVLRPGQPVDQVMSLDFYKEGAEGVTSVATLTRYGQKFLTTNRLYTQNTSDSAGLEDHRRLGHIPLLLRQGPTANVLVIGMGAGITLRGVMEENPAGADCVELSRGVYEAAKRFAAQNGGVTDDPRVRYYFDDGRNFLQTTSNKYDVIISDIFFPTSAGSSNMFSREYYGYVKKALNGGGFLMQYLPVHQLSPDQLGIIMKTCGGVFAHTSLWLGMIGDSVPVIGIMAGDSEQNFDYNVILANYSKQPKRTMSDMGLDFPETLLALYVTGDLKSFYGDARAETDDRPALEYMSAAARADYRAQGLDNLLSALSLYDPDLSRFKNLPPNGADTVLGLRAAVVQYIDSLGNQ